MCIRKILELPQVCMGSKDVRIGRAKRNRKGSLLYYKMTKHANDHFKLASKINSLLIGILLVEHLLNRQG